MLGYFVARFSSRNVLEISRWNFSNRHDLNHEGWRGLHALRVYNTVTSADEHDHAPPRELPLVEYRYVGCQVRYRDRTMLHECVLLSNNSVRSRS